MTTPSRRRVVLVGGGRVGLLGVWIVAHLVIVRHLGPHEFGVFALGVMFIKLVSSVVGDALDLAVLRGVPRYLQTDRPRALRVFWAAFQVRLLASATVLALAGLFARPMSEWYFGSSERTWLAMLVAGGITGELLLRSVSGYFQAAEAFRRFMLLEACLHLSRVGTVLVLVGMGSLTAKSALSLYVVIPFVVLALGACLLPRDVVGKVGTGFRELGEVAHHVKWLVLAFAIAAVFERVEVLLLAHFLGPAAVGVYSAALTLATIPDFVTGCFATVLLPRIVPTYAKGEFPALQRQYLRYALPIGVMVLGGALVVGPIAIETILSAKYADATSVFRVLVVGTLFQSVVTMLPGGLVGMVAPRRLVQVNVGALLASLIAGLALIPTFGTLGAAWAFVTVRILMGCWLVALARQVLRENSGGPIERLAPLSAAEP